MAENEDRPRIYTIPENFIDESRIIKGMFRTRFFIEACVMSAVVAFFVMLFPIHSQAVRITLLVGLCGPAFILGNAGFNGDPLSISLKSMVSWRQNKECMLYDPNPHALKTTPVDEMMSEIPVKDRLVDVIDEVKMSIAANRESDEEYIEGVNFEFKEDRDLEPIYADVDRKKKESENAASAEESAKEEEIPEFELSNEASDEAASILNTWMNLGRESEESTAENISLKGGIDAADSLKTENAEVKTEHESSSGEPVDLFATQGITITKDMILSALGVKESVTQQAEKSGEAERKDDAEADDFVFVSENSIDIRSFFGV